LDGAFTKHLSGASLGAKAQAKWSCSLITLQGRARILIEALITVQRVTASRHSFAHENEPIWNLATLQVDPQGSVTTRPLGGGLL
jgi:hypothetical protein